jgi:hypothetical protein
METFLLHRKHTVNPSRGTNHILLSSRQQYSHYHGHGSLLQWYINDKPDPMPACSPWPECKATCAPLHDGNKYPCCHLKYVEEGMKERKYIYWKIVE